MYVCLFVCLFVSMYVCIGNSVYTYIDMYAGMLVISTYVLSVCVNMHVRACLYVLLCRYVYPNHRTLHPSAKHHLRDATSPVPGGRLTAKRVSVIWKS